MPHRHSFILFGLLYLPAALLAVTCGIFVATTQALAAQAATSVTVLVRDLDGNPLADIAFTVVDAGGLEQVAVTDAQGSATVSVAGASVWLREATGPDGSALEMDSNTSDGGLRLPLDGTPLVVGFMVDGPLLFRAPASLDNPAFPEGLPQEQPPGAMPSSAEPTATSVAVAGAAPAPVAETDAPASGFPVALILIAAVVVLALVLLLVVWLGQVRRYRQGSARGGR